LEVACGTGNSLPFIKEEAKPGVPIVACDFSKAFLDKARAKNLQVELLQADNQALPFEDQRFDRYIANLSLHIVPDPDLMLREAFRVLKSGGIAGFTVWGKKSETNLFHIMSNALEKAGYAEEQRSHFHLNDEVELRNRFQNAGFQRVLTTYSAVGVKASKGEDLSLMFHDFPGMLGLKGSSEEIYEKTLNFAKVEAENVISGGKCMTFDLLIAVAFKP
jgi:ubiquinone/menaquinone biosynthesis C-methylase UbiE